MVDETVITNAVTEALNSQRTRWLTGGRGTATLLCALVVATASVLSAVHTWIG